MAVNTPQKYIVHLQVEDTWFYDRLRMLHSLSQACVHEDHVEHVWMYLKQSRLFHQSTPFQEPSPSLLEEEEEESPSSEGGGGL